MRDEINQLEEKHRQDLISKASEHKQLMECQAAEQLSIREELKRELAQVQMEKFKAMAAELTHVHKVIKYSLITEARCVKEIQKILI